MPAFNTPRGRVIHADVFSGLLSERRDGVRRFLRDRRQAACTGPDRARPNDMPEWIFAGGEMLRDAMRRERLTDTEVEQAARVNGATTVGEIEAMILETDGSLSVVSAVPVEHRYIHARDQSSTP